jgi:3-hydroxy-5-methyl-1-naphthoate 3-O-methyltransferase
MAAVQSETPLTPERLMQFAWGYSVPLMIEAALEHRVFDALEGSSMTVEELSRQSGASVRGLRAVMNALVSFQLLARDSRQRYSLTPESAAFLVSGKPSFQGGIFRHISDQLLPKWMQLRQIVATGQPATAVNQEGDGSEFFQKFVEDIFPMSYPAARALGESLKLAQSSIPVRVLDLASGSGVWGIALAQQSPRVTVTAVDWPGVLPATRRITARFGVADRFQMVPGDLLAADFGKDHNIATLGHILHSEGERRSRELLKKTYHALAPGGTIAIAEFIANDDRTGPPNAMIFAVNMLVNTEDGDTFTFPEIKRWLTDSGFAQVRRLEAPGPSPLTLASKP